MNKMILPEKHQILVHMKLASLYHITDHGPEKIMKI